MRAWGGGGGGDAGGVVSCRWTGAFVCVCVGGGGLRAQAGIPCSAMCRCVECRNGAAPRDSASYGGAARRAVRRRRGDLWTLRAQATGRRRRGLPRSAAEWSRRGCVRACAAYGCGAGHTGGGAVCGPREGVAAHGRRYRGVCACVCVCVCVGGEVVEQTTHVQARTHARTIHVTPRCPTRARAADGRRGDVRENGPSGDERAARGAGWRARGEREEGLGGGGGSLARGWAEAFHGGGGAERALAAAGGGGGSRGPRVRGSRGVFVSCDTFANAFFLAS